MAAEAKFVWPGNVEEAIRLIIQEIGDNPSRQGLEKTPHRVRTSWMELFAGYKQDPAKLFTVFDAENYDEMVVVAGVDFYSTCEHHLLPFVGTAAVGYLPSDGKIVGLSKLARLVDVYARRLQNQERLTKQVVEALEEHLKPLGAGCVVRAQHLCLACRGARKINATMVTCKLSGRFKTDPAARAEFLQHARG